MAKKKKQPSSEILPAVPAYETVYTLITLPEEAEATLEEAIPLQAEALSPFDEGEYTLAWEVLGRQNGMLSIWVAIASNEALTQKWHALLCARNQLASVRLDATPLCWSLALKTRDPALNEGQTLVFLRTANEQLLLLFVDGNPALFRGLSPEAGAEEVQREATWLLTQATLNGLLGETPLAVRCYVPDPAAAPEFAALAEMPAQTVVFSEEEAQESLQRALKQRVTEGKTFDLTPACWREEVRAKRRKRTLICSGILLGLLWSAAALTLFLLPKLYAQRAKTAALRIQAHRTTYNDVVDLQERIGLIMRYQDRRFSALEMLRLVCAAKAADMTFLSMTYRQKQSLRLTGLCEDTSSVYTFKETIQKDERIREVRINRLAQDAKTRQQRFDIDIIFIIESEEE